MHDHKGVMMERLAQHRGAIQEGKGIAHLYMKIPKENRICRGKVYQEGISIEILPCYHSGLGEVQPGSTPSALTGELPSPAPPGLTHCLPQVLNQSFRLTQQFPYTCTYICFLFSSMQEACQKLMGQWVVKVQKELIFYTIAIGNLSYFFTV